MNTIEHLLQQLKQTKDTIERLENELHSIRHRLKDQPHDPMALRELKQNTIDMTITLNEIEHYQSALDELRGINMRAEERYND